MKFKAMEEEKWNFIYRYTMLYFVQPLGVESNIPGYIGFQILGSNLELPNIQFENSKFF